MSACIRSSSRSFTTKSQRSSKSIAPCRQPLVEQSQLIYQGLRPVCIWRATAPIHLQMTGSDHGRPTHHGFEGCMQLKYPWRLIVQFLKQPGYPQLFSADDAKQSHRIYPADSYAMLKRGTWKYSFTHVSIHQSFNSFQEKQWKTNGTKGFQMKVVWATPSQNKSNCWDIKIMGHTHMPDLL